MKRKQTPRTDLMAAIIINIGCVLLLVYGIDTGMDDMIIFMMVAVTGVCISKTLGAVRKFKKMTGHFPNLKYESLIKPEGD